MLFFDWRAAMKVFFFIFAIVMLNLQLRAYMTFSELINVPLFYSKLSLTYLLWVNNEDNLQISKNVFLVYLLLASTKFSLFYPVSWLEMVETETYLSPSQTSLKKLFRGKG